jgi:hypothetical protein
LEQGSHRSASTFWEMAAKSDGNCSAFTPEAWQTAELAQDKVTSGILDWARPGLVDTVEGWELGLGLVELKFEVDGIYEAEGVVALCPVVVGFGAAEEVRCCFGPRDGSARHAQGVQRAPLPRGREGEGRSEGGCALKWNGAVEMNGDRGRPGCRPARPAPDPDASSDPPGGESFPAPPLDREGAVHCPRGGRAPIPTAPFGFKQGGRPPGPVR